MPDDWAEELCALRNPDLDEPLADPGPLVLSYFPDAAESWAADIGDLEGDLSLGVTVRQGRASRGNDRYTLTGTRYRLDVVARPGRESGRPLALVTGVRPNDEQLPRRAGRLTCPVTFSEVWDEDECDIGQVHRLVRQAERRRLVELQRAATTLGRVHRDRELSRHGELHRLARRRYGALRALLALLRLRAQQAAVSVDGVITQVPGTEGDLADDPYLYVEVSSQGSLRDLDGALVELATVDDAREPPRTSVRDVTGRALALELPRRGAWTVGAPVTVTTVPRFAMKQHDRALQRFLQGLVEGSWDDLAALLCAPGRLTLPRRPLPPRFFCDEDPDEKPLNEQQRSAVAGALATPHTFAVQGPPGTGKTTVICELVRQLTARGERVLMLAPNHVAVDEVLRRIGRKPGIRPLRLSWDEGHVAEELRCFLPDRVGSEFAAALRAPGPDSEERWQARHDGLRSEAAALDRLLAALAARDRADAAVEEADAARRAARTGLHDARDRHRRAIDAHTRGVAAAEAAFEAASAATERAQVEEEAARAEVTATRRPAEALLAVLDRLAATATAVGEAETAVQAATERQAAWQRQWRQAVDRSAEALGALHPQLAAAVVAASDAGRQLQAAEAALAALPPQTGVPGRLLGRLGLGARGRRARHVAQARQRWEQAERHRQQLEHEHQRLQAERQRLHAGAQARGPELAAAVEAAGARLQAVRADRAQVAGEWARASTAVHGEPRPEPSNPALVSAHLRAALDDPGSVERPRSVWVPPAHIRAHGRLGAATQERIAQQRRRAEAQEGSRLARQALVDAQRAARDEDARLTVAADQAAADVRARQTDRDRAWQELADAMTSLGDRTEPPVAEVAARRARLDRQLRVLPAYAGLRRRWVELVDGLTRKDIAAAVGTALERAVNVVCATTAGVAAAVRDADFDTLIVDEASRVIDSELLIGAIRSRRWILVGDEHQLPPHVDNQDEYHLHALAALHRHQRGVAPSLAGAVDHLARIWGEDDDEQRRFRVDQVEKVAHRLQASGQWPDLYGETFAEAHRRLAERGERGDDPDRTLLQAMRNHLVQSLLERVVAASPPDRGLRQQLILQRRMIPAIAAIVKEPVYGGAYETPDPADLEEHGVRPLTTPVTFTRPVVLLDTSSNPERRSREVGHGYDNPLECAWVVEACRRYEQEMSHREGRVTVSVLCFYQAQAELIRRRLRAPRYPGFRRLKFTLIGPVDRSQGQESDLVIVSFGRSRDRPGREFGQWLQDVRRLNVACTRAHRALVLVGHGDMLRRLRTFEPAQRFYRHLFGLLATDGYLVIEDFV